MTTPPHITPRPTFIHLDEGSPFSLAPEARITVPSEAEWVGEELAQVLRVSTGFVLPIIHEDPQTGDICLILGDSGLSDNGFTLDHEGGPRHPSEDSGASEAYSVYVTAAFVRVVASSAAGLFNGVQTLRQLFPPQVESPSSVSGPWRIDPVTVVDGPRFAFRAIMLDVCRSFLTVEQVRRHLDVMSSYKFNVLQLHLTDDQAWRLELNNPDINPTQLDYRALTAIGGKGAVNTPGTGLSAGDTGFYTQADFAEIVHYAELKNVLVIPELDLPGHVNAALASIPELNPDGVTPPMNVTGDVGYSTLAADHPPIYEFVREALRQFAAMTPGQYLHVGGDEALVTGRDSYVRMMNQFSQMVNELGKTVVAWNEAAEADIPSGSVLQYWSNGWESVLHQVRDNGAKVIMSPGTNTYLDMKYHDATPIGLIWAGTGDWERFYDWNPVQSGLTEEDVLGVAAALWTETVRGNDQAFWMSYPRAIAVAEVAWSQQERRSLQDLAARLPGLGERLVLQDVPFYPSPSIEWTITPRSPFAKDSTNHVTEIKTPRVEESQQ